MEKDNMSGWKVEEVPLLLGQKDRCQIKSVMKSRLHVNQEMKMWNHNFILAAENISREQIY